MKVTTYLIFLSSFAILGHAYLTCQDCGDLPCKDVNDNGEVKECDEGALGCLYSEKHGMNDLSNHNNQWISNSISHCRARRRYLYYRTKMFDGIGCELRV